MHVPLASAWCRQRSSIVGKYVFPSSGQYPTGPTEGAVTYVFHPQWQILEKVELQGCVIWDWTGCFSEHFAAQMPLFRQMEKATYGLMFHNTTAGTAALHTN